MAINDKFEGVDGATESDEEDFAAVQQLLMAMHRSRDGGQASCPVSQRLRRHLVGDAESVAASTVRLQGANAYSQIQSVNATPYTKFVQLGICTHRPPPADAVPATAGISPVIEPD